jgi:2-hydroxychromene-2-carboxylate isomerase
VPNHVDFYFWTGSTYTYLTVKRINAAAARDRIEVRWKPFNLRTLLRENNHVPFPSGRAKTEYMWRDLERRAEMYGLAFPTEKPAYPSDPETLNFKAALIAYEEGWAKEYALTAFEWWFIKGKPPGMDGNLAAMLNEMGRDAGAILSRIEAPEMDKKMVASADEARALGLFGSPHFVVGKEVFWGDDRLEDALSWAKAERSA